MTFVLNQPDRMENNEEREAFRWVMASASHIIHEMREKKDGNEQRSHK